MNISAPVIGLDKYKSDTELKNVVLFVGYPDVALKLISLFCIIFIAIGVPGNFITIVSFIRSKQIQNATAIFIINLSVTDLLFCALILPIVMFSYWTRSWIFGRAMCRLYPLLNYTLVTVSLCTVIAIAINRYVIVCHPMHYHKLYTKKNICIMLIIIWTFALGILLMPFFELWGRMGLDHKASACTIIPDKNKKNLKKTIFTTLLITTAAIILLCYIRILLVVKKSRSKTRRPGTIQLYSIKNTQNITYDDSTVCSNITDYSGIVENCMTKEIRQSVVHLSSHRTNDVKQKLPTKKDKKLRTMVSALMICLFVCYIPITLKNLLYTDPDICPTCNIIAYILIYAAPCLNPILYVVISKEYRQAYKSVIICYQ